MLVLMRTAAAMAMFVVSASQTMAQQTDEAAKDTAQIVTVTDMIPEHSEPPVYHANGMVSVRVGMDTLEYLWVEVDDDGNKVFSHIGSDDASVEKALNGGTTGPEEQ